MSKKEESIISVIEETKKEIKLRTPLVYYTPPGIVDLT